MEPHNNPWEDCIYRALYAQRCFIAGLVGYLHENRLTLPLKYSDQINDCINNIYALNETVSQACCVKVDPITEIWQFAKKQSEETTELEKLYGLDDPRPIPREGV